MQASKSSWIAQKAWIALPVILVLVLARCSGDSGEAAKQAQAAQQNQANSEPSEVAEPSQSTGKRFGSEEIKAAMVEHIRRRTEFGNPGVFEITDPRTSENLELTFQRIHDPVRVIDGKYYFACTNFAAYNDPKKTYDLDFWLQEVNGKLVVYEENVHKLPIRSENKWVQEPRYNFVNDRINLLR